MKIVYTKYENILLKIILTLLSFELIIYIFLSNLEKEYLFQITTSIVGFTGIFSAIIISLLITKVYNIRSEKIERKNKIISFSNEVTDLRRLSRLLLADSNFWPADLQRELNTKYKSLSFTFYNSEMHKAEITKIIKEYEEYSKYPKTLTNLYLALRELQGDVTEKQLMLYNSYDYDYTYDSKIISTWNDYNIANQLYVSLKYHYNDISSYLNFSNINIDVENDITELVNKMKINIYPTSINNTIIGEVGTYFDSYIFPYLTRLQYQNSHQLPELIKFLSSYTLIILFIGVIIPFFFLLANITNQYILKIDYTILLFTYIYFVYKIKGKIINELRM